MNVLCDDGNIMTHVNEKNDNAGGMLFLWFVYYYYHNSVCDGVRMWITIMRM